MEDRVGVLLGPLDELAWPIWQSSGPVNDFCLKNGGKIPEEQHSRLSSDFHVCTMYICIYTHTHAQAHVHTCINTHTHTRSGEGENEKRREGVKEGERNELSKHEGTAYSHHTPGSVLNLTQFSIFIRTTLGSRFILLYGRKTQWERWQLSQLTCPEAVTNSLHPQQPGGLWLGEICPNKWWGRFPFVAQNRHWGS